MQAIRLKRTIQKSGELHLTNLSVVEGEHVELLLLFTSTTKTTKRKKRLTARQLLNSNLMGMWQDRADITDSVEYAHKLREQAQRRS